MRADTAVQPDLVLVSDLHLGGYDATLHAHDGDVAEFLHGVTRAQHRRGRAWRLVLLGDLLDFTAAAPPSRSRDRGAPARRAEALLDDLETRSPAALLALRELVRAGVGIDVVAGNHDYELMHPGVQRVLLERWGAGGGGQVVFHPWIYHVPGLLYAEHGSQHHDINRVGGLLDQVEQLARGDVRTPAALLSRSAADSPAATAARNRVVRAAALTARLVPTVLAATRADRGAARAAYASGALHHHARVLDLPTELLAQLDAVSSAAVLPMARRIAGRLLRRSDSPSAPDYMLASAARVHRVLTSHGRGTPLYVFGHTHSARREVLASVGGAPTAVYFNTGTWSPLRRGDGSVDAGRPTWVHVDATARRGRLGRWGLDEL